MDMRLFDTRVTRVVVDVYGMNACGTCLQLVPGRAVLQGGIRGGGRRLVFRGVVGVGAGGKQTAGRGYGDSR